MKDATSGNRFHPCAGIGIVEVLIVLLVACTVAGFALVSADAILRGVNSNKGMQQAMAQLRLGRQWAMAQRRNIRLQFVGDDQIQLTRLDLPSGATVLSTVSFGRRCRYLLFSDLPDTPDQFGNSAAIDFSGASSLTFLSDGTLVDNGGNPVNGTLFLGLPGHPEVARAVTILGATGRVRGYRWAENKWIQ